MKKGWIWPLVPVVVLGFSVTMHITLVSLAASDPSIAVEKDYYSKALRWDDHQAQERRNRKLGWQVALWVEPSRYGPATVEARLTTPDGAPVGEAKIEARVFHHARAARIHDVTFTPGDKPGSYRTTVPLRRGGKWEFRFRVKQGDQLFTSNITHYVGAR